ncbi:hypothetical protein HYFRA_00012869 [Hymenoscyphus fraxineus]|uniref:Uncharacterized protein n=1 Tax=Hymenoscyphus fraxineus TaxID=746836 RepID=A0A9N9L6P0_9HELO|nr:hypothetical protein HYFRA_00012869 [Hymenoscyphus fraxineus]
MLFSFISIATLFSSALAIPATGLPNDGIQRWKVTNWLGYMGTNVPSRFEFEVEGDEYGPRDGLVPPSEGGEIPSAVPPFFGICKLENGPFYIAVDGTDWVECDLGNLGSLNNRKLEVRAVPTPNPVKFGTDGRIQLRYTFLDPEHNVMWEWSTGETKVYFDDIKVGTFNIDVRSPECKPLSCFELGDGAGKVFGKGRDGSLYLLVFEGFSAFSPGFAKTGIIRHKDNFVQKQNYMVDKYIEAC